MNAARQWFNELAARERLFVLVGAVAAAAFLLLMLLLPLNRSVSAAERRVIDKRRDLTWLQAVAPQVVATSANSNDGGSNESLVVLADRVAQATGIARSLTGSQPSGNGGLRVRVEKAPFDALATWLGQLTQQYGIGVETASVDALSTPGLVNATIVLRPR